MCVATTTAIAIGAGAASSIYAAKKGADTAKDAAKTQSAAAQQAIDLQKTQYQQARQDFNPYQQAGAGAVGRLQQRAAAPPPAFTPGQPSTFSLGNPQGMPQQGPPQPMQGGPQQMVKIQSPDGEVRPIPANLVPMALQRGGRVVQ